MSGGQESKRALNVPKFCEWEKVLKTEGTVQMGSSHCYEYKCLFPWEQDEWTFF